MRILQLNAWTGRIKGGILKFLQENTFDIICLQEAVWTDGDGRELEYFFASVRQMKEAAGLDYEVKASNWGVTLQGEKIEQGNVILSKEPFVETEVRELCGDYGHRTMSPQENNDQLYTAIKAKLKNGLTIFNYHGFWEPDPIGDQRTVEAMRKAVTMIQDVEGPLIMCGDLNVNYESPAMRELDFLTDLTHTHNVKNTLAGLKFAGAVACDHILVNEHVKTSRFKVHPEIVSDHLALSTDFTIH